MRVNVKKLIEKHIKLIENENFRQLFINANYQAFSDDSMNELIKIIEDIGYNTLDIRKELFAEVLDESVTPFMSGTIDIMQHIELVFYNRLALDDMQIIEAVNKHSTKAKVDPLTMMMEMRSLLEETLVIQKVIVNL